MKNKVLFMIIIFELFLCNIKSEGKMFLYIMNENGRIYILDLEDGKITFDRTFNDLSEKLVSLNYNRHTKELYIYGGNNILSAIDSRSGIITKKLKHNFPSIDNEVWKRYYDVDIPWLVSPSGKYIIFEFWLLNYKLESNQFIVETDKFIPRPISGGFLSNKSSFFNQSENTVYMETGDFTSISVTDVKSNKYDVIKPLAGTKYDKFNILRYNNVENVENVISAIASNNQNLDKLYLIEIEPGNFNIKNSYELSDDVKKMLESSSLFLYTTLPEKSIIVAPYCTIREGKIKGTHGIEYLWDIYVFNIVKKTMDKIDLSGLKKFNMESLPKIYLIPNTYKVLIILQPSIPAQFNRRGSDNYVIEEGKIVIINLEDKEIEKIFNTLPGGFVDLAFSEETILGQLPNDDMKENEMYKEEVVKDKTNLPLNKDYSDEEIEELVKKVVKSNKIVLKKEIVKSGKIEFIEKEYNFGKVKKDEKVSKIFRLKNVGEGSLEIERVEVSSSCISSVIKTKEVKPGEEGEIEIMFDTSGKRGLQSYIIKVYSNASDKPVEELRIMAEIE